METHPGDGVVKEERFPNSREPSHWQVPGEFWNLKSQQNQVKKKREREYVPNYNSQQRSSPDDCVRH